MWGTKRKVSRGREGKDTRKKKKEGLGGLKRKREVVPMSRRLTSRWSFLGNNFS
jgi:hypothetical protein